MKIVINIDENTYHRIISGFANEDDATLFEKLFKDGKPLPKGHSFIAICDSDFPITEEVKEDLKNTVFVGNDCRYCFDMTEIIETDKEYKAEVITRGNCMICGKELTEGLFLCKECEDKAKKERNNK